MNLQFRSLTLAVLLCAPALGACVEDQAQPPPSQEARTLKPRAPFAKPTEPRYDWRAHTGNIVVKFAEGGGIRLRGGQLLTIDGAVHRGVHSLIASLGRVERVFSRPEQALTEEKARGEALTGKELADLNLFYYIKPTNLARSDALSQLVVNLNALSDVETAYFESQPVPARADIAPPSDNYESFQGYLDAAPYGVDARYAWEVPGGRGDGGRFIDIEQGWFLGHEDLKDTFIAPISTSNIWARQDHGTAVLGVIAADSNGFGITGIAFNSEYSVATSQQNNINVASASLGPGDVIVLEIQIAGPVPPSESCGSTDPQGKAWVPWEYDAAAFGAVETATANQRIVIAAAGNGAANLDAVAYEGRFDRSVRDSGAIIVGARIPGTGAAECFSNYGSRVDTSAWGRSVATTGCETFASCFSWGDVNQRYTLNFAGTSSATPIVAGSALAIQGIQRARGGSLIGPGAMRAILAAHGTSQDEESAASRHIGPLPDLRATHAWMLSDDDGDGVKNIDELVPPALPPSEVSPAALQIIIRSILLG